MAASSLLHSPSHPSRKGQTLSSIYSFHSERNGICFSFNPQQPKCNVKLHAMTHISVTLFRAVRCFKANGSEEMHGSPKAAVVSSSVIASNNLQRSKTLLDCSSNSANTINDLEKQLQELFVDVKIMLKAGNTDGAANLLKANFEAVKAQVEAGAKGMVQAAKIDIIALGYMSMGDYKFVEYLLQMLNEIVGNVKNDEPFLDSVLMHMGSMYTNFGKFEEAMRSYQRGLEILERLFGKTSPYLITPLLGIAKVYTSIRRASKAIDFYKRAVSILEASRGADSEDVVVPLSGLGNLLIKEGRAPEAEVCFDRIVSIYSKLYGENDGRVGMATCSLAHAKCAKGNLDEAIQLYRKGLLAVNNSKYLDIEDEVLEKIRIDLAELLHVAGRECEGRELLEECLLITEKYRGNEHLSSITHILNLATSYSRSKNYPEAERLIRTALQIMKKSTDPLEQSITVPMLHLAVILYNLNRDEEAEHFALEAVRLREEAFGTDSLLVGEALDCLVSIQTRLGKDDTKILILLRRVLSIQEKEFGFENEEVMITLQKIVFYLNRMGKKDEKLLLQRRLSRLRTMYKDKFQS
ncbi:hypothetical protein GIB67_033372 [Kingdonia uniflora]|uniref:Nephrocystin-3 n=1 Tax=Kingdonia uniflora TaxID=39325 RepID=A0A7J7LTP1_9MAGN|nr:hypothetical protein GIB67_033372 [Kingdonia uniflora]